MKKLICILLSFVCIVGLLSCGTEVPNASEPALMDKSVSTDPETVAEKIKSLGYTFEYTYEIYDSAKDNGNNAVLYYAKNGEDGADYLMAYRYKKRSQAAEAWAEMSTRGVGKGLFPDAEIVYVDTWIFVGIHGSVYQFFDIDPAAAKEMNEKNSENMS